MNKDDEVKKENEEKSIDVQLIYIKKEEDSKE